MTHTDPTKRHEFVLLFEVTDGNPNGDPDGGNMPRTDPETMQGLVTDVSLKRKIRNFVTAYAQDLPEDQRSSYNIYVENRGVLNAQHRKAYTALNIQTAQPASLEINDEAIRLALQENGVPDGFSIEEENDTYILHYSGELNAEDLKTALDTIKEETTPAVAKFVESVTKKAKSMKVSRENVHKAQDWMCQNFYDVRMFGAVMSTGVNAGQVRGPVQLTFARSIDPVLPRDLSITRVAITREEDKEKKETEMGRKALIHYGLYMARGFYSPHLAAGTHVVQQDLEVFWHALIQMWALDRSASRGMMTPRGLYVFTHESKLGNAPAHQLFERINVKSKETVTAARAFTDYTVTINEKEMPTGVTLTKLLEG
jgi:CRISPR-associated protein Csd2